MCVGSSHELLAAWLSQRMGHFAQAPHATPSGQLVWDAIIERKHSHLQMLRCDLWCGQ